MKIRFNRKRLKKFLSGTGIVLCTIASSGTLLIGAYDASLNSKLDRINVSSENISVIKNYYQKLNANPTILIMNDSQGVNVNLGFWKNSYSEYLEEWLDAEVIDNSSLRFNKVSHIDMLLDNNLSIAEMKKLNNAGNYYATKKIANDIGVPFLSEVFGNIGQNIFSQKVNEGDDKVHISDLIMNTCEPIIIFSSGANDLMFLANANPNSLKKYDEDGNITDKYLYAKNILCNSSVIDSVISNIESEFNKIISLNLDSKIFALSIYVPSTLENSDYKVFANAISEYNQKLEELCQKYNICFIDESSLGKIYNNKEYDFHLDEVGHKQLASMVINEISKNLSNKKTFEPKDYYYDSDGLEGYYYDLVGEIGSVNLPSKDDITKNKYLMDVYLSQLNDKYTDSEICKKLVKTIS